MSAASTRTARINDDLLFCQTAQIEFLQDYFFADGAPCRDEQHGIRVTGSRRKLPEHHLFAVNIRRVARIGATAPHNPWFFRKSGDDATTFPLPSDPY